MFKIIGKFILFIGVLAFLFCKNTDTSKNTVQGATTQEPTISSATQNDLMRRFPKAQEVYWDTLENSFSATFFDGKYDCKAFYDADSKFQYATSLIEQEALPQAINRYIKEKYKKAEIAIVQSVNDGKKQTFHIELETHSDYLVLDFDASGKLLKETKDPLSNDELKRQEEEGVEKN